MALTLVRTSGSVQLASAQAPQIRSAAQGELQVSDPLPALTAAVEVTAYRIVVEALTNAARHSTGDHITVTLGIDAHTLTSRYGTTATPTRPGPLA